jgi:glutathione synthase
MKTKLGVVMDPIGAIHVKKDSTFAMLLAAQKRGLAPYYFEQGDLFLRDGQTFGRARRLAVTDDPAHWFSFEGEETVALGDFDLILMRKDPPVDTEYLYTTYLLERAEEKGALVVNKPQALRDAHEKLFSARFAHLAPPTLVTRDMGRLRDFLQEHGDIVVKPLDGMGGRGVFRLRRDDPNASVVFETQTALGTQSTMAQRYLPEIKDGDKRILLIDGRPLEHALARVPAVGESRGNLAAGGRGVGAPLSARDRAICAEVGPALKDRGLVFVGLDVIGDYLTEINVTSPTCIRELDKLYELDIAGDFIDVLLQKVKARS